MTSLALDKVKPSHAIHKTRYRNSELTVQRQRHDDVGETRFGPFPADDAFVAVLQVGRLPAFSYWVDGKRYAHDGGLPGAMNIFDLQSGPSCLIDGPVDNLHLRIPRNALDDFADEVDAPRIERLHVTDGWDTADPVAGGLVQSIAAVYERGGDSANQLVADHAVLALYTHLVTAYGGVRIAGRQHSGGLAPRQERAAKELMVANMTGKLSLAEVAEATGLSVAHFSRAFKSSTSVTPHAWLQSQRIEKAKMLLLEDREKGLAEIGLASGFADQSHFTRVFSKVTGATPGAWRRCRA